jgi:hypothetical protein
MIGTTLDLVALLCLGPWNCHSTSSVHQDAETLVFEGDSVGSTSDGIEERKVKWEVS